MSLFNKLRKALLDTIESVKHKEFKKHICFVCDNIIENDGNYENNIKGIIFDGIGGWFSEFDWIFDGTPTSKPEVFKRIAVCDKCLRAKEHLMATLREVNVKTIVEVESGHKLECKNE